MRSKGLPAAVVTALAAGIALFVLAGLASRRPPVTATPTTATALNDLTAHDCNNAHPLKVSFQWEGRQVVADDQPDCERDYRAGEQITVYVASSDPSNIGPTEKWILDPSAHDPFDFIGPNGMPGFLTMLGVIATSVACGLMVKRLRRRRQPPAEPSPGDA